MKSALPEITKRYYAEASAKIYHADPLIVATLKEIIAQKGIRALSRALNQIHCERRFISRRGAISN